MYFLKKQLFKNKMQIFGDILKFEMGFVLWYDLASLGF